MDGFLLNNTCQCGHKVCIRWHVISSSMLPRQRGLTSVETAIAAGTHFALSATLCRLPLSLTTTLFVSAGCMHVLARVAATSTKLTSLGPCWGLLNTQRQYTTRAPTQCELQPSRDPPGVVPVNLILESSGLTVLACRKPRPGACFACCLIGDSTHEK